MARHMTVKKRIENLSKVTRGLLLEGENERLDFKRRVDGISSDDLIAFANSETGGQILVGVDERTEGKIEIGVVCGCDVSDAAILQVLNKSVSCLPPVALNVFIENLKDKPIIRIEIPSSSTKPHCTQKGTYCRRDGTRNRPLHPSELLRLFLDSEARAFAARFEVAAERITNELSDLQSSLQDSINSMSDQLGWADFKFDDTESTLDQIQGLIAKLTQDTDKANSRLRTLFAQDQRDDPVQQDERRNFVNECVDKILSSPDILSAIASEDELTLRVESSENRDVSEDDKKELIQLAIDHVRRAERDKQYQILVRPPKAFSNLELEQFVEIVERGGEVANGVAGRAKRAFQLGFIACDGKIVGTAALKRPTESYKQKVFKKAKSELDPAQYEFEIGWIYLEVPHRGKGQMTRLLDALLRQTDLKPLFATTRVSNEIMREMLEQLRFQADGFEYASDSDLDSNLKLFVRKAEGT
jgi:RimJ/RimL family protein N-acetyltransferase